VITLDSEDVKLLPRDLRTTRLWVPETSRTIADWCVTASASRA